MKLRQFQRYLVELGLALGLYAALLAVSVFLLRHGVSAAWRVPVSVMPVAALGLAAWAIIRHLNRCDEMQRRMQFDAISAAFLGTALISMSYGFLENAGFPRLSMFAVWPVMAALWAAGSIVSMVRYRA
jgi:hypothetical protein